MGAWDDITVENLDIDGRFTGIEPDALVKDGVNVHLRTAKDSLRRKAESSLGLLYVDYSISETGLFDALAALSDTGDAKDLKQHLLYLLRYETLAAFYHNAAGRSGRKTDLRRRAEEYADEARDGLPELARLTREAIANNDLTLASDVSVKLHEVLWVT